MFNQSLADAIASLFTMNLGELLAIVALIILFASLTIKLTKTNRDSLAFVIWGVLALLAFLVFRLWAAEPNLAALLRAHGLIITLAVFAFAGVVLGAMAFGLYRVFLRPYVRTRSVYLYSSSYSPRRAARNGRKDGKVGVNSKHYEESLLHFAEQNANLIAQTWSDKDKKLKAAYCSVLAKRQSAFAALGQAKEISLRPQRDLLQEEEKFKSTYGSHHLSTGPYWVVLGLIGLAEFPFNLAAFRAMLGEVEVVNMFFSLVVSGIFAGAIHSLGQFFAENPFEKGVSKVLAKNPISIFSIFFLALVIIGLARFRESYIASFQKQLGTYGIGFDISPAMASLILGVIVAFFAILAIDIGRRRYRPDVTERRTALAHANKRHRSADRNMAKAERLYHRLSRKFYKAEAARRSEFAFMQGAAETVNKKMQEFIKIYRMHYERAAKRKRSRDAVSFDPLPSVDVPPILRTLDERCTD